MSHRGAPRFCYDNLCLLCGVAHCIFSWVCTIIDFGVLYGRLENSGRILVSGGEEIENVFIEPSFLLM